MATIEIGKKVPAFSAPGPDGKKIKLSDFKGKRVVLYFYPKDNTPGCTQEAIDFQSRLGRFTRLNTVVLGVSRDSVQSHEKFCSKHGLKLTLLADEDEKICQLFDVIKEKNMYGRKVRGIERSTFLIDEKGVLRQAWRKVKVPGHVDTVLDAVKNL